MSIISSRGFSSIYCLFQINQNVLRPFLESNTDSEPYDNALRRVLQARFSVVGGLELVEYSVQFVTLLDLRLQVLEFGRLLAEGFTE